MNLSSFFKIFCLLVTTSYFSWAQEGTLRGTIIDDDTGEPLFSANVIVKGTQRGASTDFDGKFSINVPAGTYDVEISFIGMSTTNITGVEIKANEVKSLELIRLKPASNSLEQITVTAEAVRNTEAAILTLKSKSVNVMDGISAQAFKKIGDGDAAEAVKRVAGVSIQNGKYVFVRGLGDRYTKTTLHGLDIPGLDPDRNSLQMDIFPTNIISNITVLKSFTADLPADFVGGVVNIETAEFPDKPELSTSASVGFTPGMHFNSEYLTQEGSSTDILGFDNGYREEPLDMGRDNPEPTGQFSAPTSQSAEQTAKFNDDLAAEQGTSPMNFSLGVSGGDQIKTDKYTYGYTGAFSYKNSTDFYRNWQQNIYRKEALASDVYDLSEDVLTSGDLAVNNVYLSGLVGGAMKTLTSKYKINLMHLQNGERKSGYFNEENKIENNNVVARDNLEYSERSITNLLLSGEHVYDGGDWNIEWKVSPTYSRINDKDVRTTPYVIDFVNGEERFRISQSEADWPQRIWRGLNEYDVASRLDFDRTHRAFGDEAKLKFGAGYTFKTRDYEILRYDLISQSPGSFDYTGDADELLSDGYVYDGSNRNGYFYVGNYQRNNTYSGIQSTLSLYVSEEFHILPDLRAITGVRYERYDQYYTGQNQIANVDPDAPSALVFDNESVLALNDFFPTVNLIWALSDKQNLRGAYFRTTARPSFKEKSTAEIVDVLSGLTFIGNINLEATYIDNFDLRYEYFMQSNQMISVSGFYKTFTNPIELVSYQQDPNSFQPRNVGDARVMGVEFELRLNLDFITESLKNFSFNTNISLIDSRVTYDKSPNGTYQAKQTFLREGEELGNYRDMQGQAPYIVNGVLSYNGLENGYQAAVSYNVQGPKLMLVGINLSPDIYSVPFHSLNFNVSKKFGANDNMRLGFAVDNILNDARETETRSFRASERVFNFFNPGRTFSLSFSYDIK